MQQQIQEQQQPKKRNPRLPVTGGIIITDPQHVDLFQKKRQKKTRKRS